MLTRLEIDALIQERYRVERVFGSAETTAAYLVTDLSSNDSYLLWESAERFTLSSKPPGVREYFVENDKHYLVLRLENQTLSFLLTMAGQVDETLAGLWLIQICRAIGAWHNRPKSEPLICLRQGGLSLALFRLLGYDQVMIPSYGDFGREVQPVVEADGYRFSAPEQEPEKLSPRSDVYALGALLYCLVTGRVPPQPEALQARQARLEPPRRLVPGLSHDMERVILKAMQQDPQRRYPTATEMAADLEAFLIPRLVEDKKAAEKKPSLLTRLVPFFVALMLLACLAAGIEAVRRPEIDLSWLLAHSDFYAGATDYALGYLDTVANADGGCHCYGHSYPSAHAHSGAQGRSQPGSPRSVSPDHHLCQCAG
jgi:serine/threonine protein kinase